MASGSVPHSHPMPTDVTRVSFPGLTDDGPPSNGDSAELEWCPSPLSPSQKGTMSSPTANTEKAGLGRGLTNGVTSLELSTRNEQPPTAFEKDLARTQAQ
jgi:hypothetical protein